jgi:hypothetical protein
MFGSISIGVPSLDDDRVFRLAYDMIRREVGKRSFVPISHESGDLKVELSMDADIGTEGFRITHVTENCIAVTGNDELGLLYGVGSFLRGATYGDDGFLPSPWQGVSLPEKKIRGIYFASHFHNFYHDAPFEEVERYIQEIVPRGFNTLCVWFDMHHYRSADDAEAIAMIARIHRILEAAKGMFLKTCLTVLANESFSDSPKELRASFTAGHDGYVQQLAGHYHVEICPSRVDGLELLIRQRTEVLRRFTDVEPDFVVIWPYDQGGCTCSACAPWGSNGFLTVAENVAEVAKSIFPNVRIILSTWLFDHFTTGEWKGLAEAFVIKPEWVDYLLLEFMEGAVPAEILADGMPGGLPCIGFPEISMYGATPWGGFGANPIPENIQKVWSLSGRYVSGGFLYSEGIFEDLNKYLYARLYWGDARDIYELVREYVAFEFGSTHIEEILRGIRILEKTIVRNRLDEDGIIHNYPDDKIPWKGEQRFVIVNTEGIDDVFELFSKVDDGLPGWVRASWRWRILYWRSLIDRELFHNGFKTSMRLEEAYARLTELYHASNADYCVAPPCQESIRLNRGGFSWT